MNIEGARILESILGFFCFLYHVIVTIKTCMAKTWNEAKNVYCYYSFELTLGRKLYFLLQMCSLKIVL